MSAPVTHKAPASATVGVTSAEVLAFNNSRRYAILINDSANKIFLGFGVPAELNKGILIAAGSNYEILDINLTFQAIEAIADIAGSVLLLQEANR